MNFLAHCLLAARADDDHDHDLVSGGILGDFWKGAVPPDWPSRLQTGVRLHRRIDAVSNRHPDVRRSCARFPGELRRYAPVLVDIHADLALARNWGHHSADPLGEFAGRCYQSLANLDAVTAALPEGLARFVAFMRERDLLRRYGTWEGVELCIQGMSRRLGRPEMVPVALAACRELSKDLDSDFQAYFPDLVREAAEFVRAER